MDREDMVKDHALPPNWETMDYTDFLAERRVLMASVIKRGFLALS